MIQNNLVQYISEDAIKALENKINDAQQDPDIKMNEDREKQVIKLITELKENIKKNHPFK